MNAIAEELFLSVVVLCYRSGKTIVPLFEKLYRMLSLLHDKWEIILVGNYIKGADDETPAIVKMLERKYPSTRALTLPKEGMMGWDMRKGLNAASGKYIALLDGDGQFPLESGIACLLKIESNNHDLVNIYCVR